VTVRSAGVDDLDVRTLHAILRLRVDVFVVEQTCPYPEIDGRDVEAATVQWWWEEDGEVLACLRVLREPDGGARIGRVATAVRARGRGLAATLIRAALAGLGDDVVLGAQSHLVDWYRRLGFVPDGEEYDEDGIPHTPMRLG
jgi:ElaA protein